MFNLEKLAREHELIGGHPPKHVARALRHADDWHAAISRRKRVPEVVGDQLLDAAEALQHKLNGRHKKRAEVEQQVADYITRVVLPVYQDPWLQTLAATMRCCHQSSVWYWHEKAHKTLLRWNAKCECVQLCPHAAAEEAERMQDRYVLRFGVLKTLGYTLQKVVVSPRCVTRHDAVKPMDNAAARQYITHQRWLAFCDATDQELAKAWTLTPLKVIENYLQRTQQRMMLKLQGMFRARWPRHLAKKFYLLDIGDTKDNRERYERGRSLRKADPKTLTDQELADRNFFGNIAGKKGLIFPELKGLQVTIESPLNYEGHWHPHLNVLYAVKGPCIDWGLWRRYWNNAHCRFTTESDMWAVTESRMRARGQDTSAMSWNDVLRFALKEIVKYPLATVAEKSGKNQGAWTGGEPGQGVYVNDAGKHLAPPMVDWPADAFMEWWYAHYNFRRSRSYGKLFRGFETEGGDEFRWSDIEAQAEKGEDLDPLLWIPMGVVERLGGAFVVSQPLLTFLPGNNSDATGPPPDNPYPPVGPGMSDQDELDYYARCIRRFEYMSAVDPREF